MTMLDPRLFVESSTLLNLKNQAQRLALNSQFRPSGIFSGQNASKLRGQGLSFEELRTFRVGDNIKFIDWKASSRANNRVVKVFTQETDRPAVVICDQRLNMFFGSQVYMKSVIAAHLATLMAWLLHLRGDRVGGVVLGPEQSTSLLPSRMASQITRYITNMAAVNQSLGQRLLSSSKTQSQLHETLSDNLHMLGSSGTLVLVTDGLELVESDILLLKRLSTKHNVIVLLVNDLLEMDYQSASDLVISDGSQQIKLDNNPNDILRYQTATSEQLASIHRAIHQLGLPFGNFNTVDEPYLQLNQLLRGHG